MCKAPGCNENHRHQSKAKQRPLGLSRRLRRAKTRVIRTRRLRTRRTKTRKRQTRKDSDHKSAVCPQRGNRCKAWPFCKLEHRHHECRICGNKDADHKSQQCPKRHSATLYHGAPAHVGPSIKAHGMKASAGGRLGAGVYATSSFEAARRVAIHNSTPGIVVILKVDLGKMKDLYDKSQDDLVDGTHKWRTGGYDSAYAAHPPWIGLKHLREFCIPDASRCKVMEIKNV